VSCPAPKGCFALWSLMGPRDAVSVCGERRPGRQPCTQKYRSNSGIRRGHNENFAESGTVHAMRMTAVPRVAGIRGALPAASGLRRYAEAVPADSPVSSRPITKFRNRRNAAMASSCRTNNAGTRNKVMIVAKTER
jgi:hypothetical protein